MAKALRCLFVSILFSFQSAAKDYALYSPDKNIQVIVSVTDKVMWSIKYKNEVMLQPGELAMAFEHDITLGKNSVVGKEKRKR
jgi:hypothetical protein